MADNNTLYHFDEDGAQHNRLMAVLEGFCPDCKEEMQMTALQGLEDFLTDYGAYRITWLISEWSQQHDPLDFVAICDKLATKQMLEVPDPQHGFVGSDQPKQAWYPPMQGVDLKLWWDRPEPGYQDDRGMFEYTCPKCKKKFEAYQSNVDGDWVMGG